MQPWRFVVVRDPVVKRKIREATEQEESGAVVRTEQTRGGGPASGAKAGPDPTVVGRIDDMSVVSFRTARHTLFLAGDVEPAGLMQLAEAVAGPLYAQLAGA